MDSYFKCCLCEKLVSPVNPLECTQCHVVFCQQCIDDFVTDRIMNSSSQCMQSLSKQSVLTTQVKSSLIVCPSGCQNLEVQGIHTFARQVLDRVILSCPNANEDGAGCQNKVRYCDYVKHVTQTCGELLVHC